MKNIVIYDTTLRDGAQTPGVNFSLENKLKITRLLDKSGIHYIEGGWPNATNPADTEYFSRVKDQNIKAKIAAFGMTAKTRDVENDVYLHALIDADPDVYAIVGKSIKSHLEDIISIDPEEYLYVVRDSVQFLKSQGREVIFDAEHFFDGLKDDKDYALRVLEAARYADCIVLCDTNGGRLPEEIYEGVMCAMNDNILGIHCHNDAGLAVTNTLTAVDAGVRHVQGTINGLGERAGNVNLCTIIPNLELKKGYETIGRENLRKIKKLAEDVGRISGRRVVLNDPYVGNHAFAHKAGLHSDAIMKTTGIAYEHIDPLLVGNKTTFPASDQAGRAFFVKKAREFGYKLDKGSPVISNVMSQIKEKPHSGDAQLFLMFYKLVNKGEYPFEMIYGKATTIFGDMKEASLKIKVGNEVEYEIEEGDGLVNAIDRALRKALRKHYPEIDNIKLEDYNVGLPSSEHGTEAWAEVIIILSNNGHQWESKKSSTDVIEASAQALEDAYKYYLIRERFKRDL